MQVPVEKALSRARGRNSPEPFPPTTVGRATHGSALPPAMPPHIVLLLGDDYPWQMWPRTAEMAALTPTLAATFVSDGLDLTRHYAARMCAPSRASLLSGRLMHRVYDMSHGMSACLGISPGMTTLATKLAEGAAYRTHFVGKWHVGYATQSYAPWHRGFESSYGFLANAVDHFTHCSYRAPPADDYSARMWCRTTAGKHDHDASVLYDWFEADGEDVRYMSPGRPGYTNATYLTELHTSRATEIIGQHAALRGTAPLFLYLAFAAVHSPLQATPELLARVDALRGDAYFESCGWFDWGPHANPTPLNPASPQPTRPSADDGGERSTCVPWKRRLIEAMALSIDDAVAAVVGALHEGGMWEDSLMVSMSTHTCACHTHTALIHHHAMATRHTCV